MAVLAIFPAYMLTMASLNPCNYGERRLSLRQDCFQMTVSVYWPLIKAVSPDIMTTAKVLGRYLLR